MEIHDPEQEAVIGEGDQPLVGEQKTLFQTVGEDTITAAIENARLEQEMICGYALVTQSSRYTHMRDAQGRDIYEVYATYAPAETYVAPDTDAA